MDLDRGEIINADFDGHDEGVSARPNDQLRGAPLLARPATEGSTLERRVRLTWGVHAFLRAIPRYMSVLHF